MRAQHRRPAPYRPRLEFAIAILGLVICGIGLGRITADVLANNTASIVPNTAPIVPQERTTTTSVIDSSMIAPETTTTTTVLARTTQPPRTAKQQIRAKVPVARYSPPDYGYGGRR
jgi:hypothetical protein